MKHLLSLTGILALALPGCVPHCVPAISPDGTRIAVVRSIAGPPETDGSEGEARESLCLVDPAGASSRLIALDPAWKLIGAHWIGDRLAIGASEAVPDAPAGVLGADRRSLLLFVDPVSGALTRTAMPVSIGSLPSLGTFAGAPALLAVDDAHGATVAYTLDGQKVLGSLPFVSEDAGHGWRVRVVSKQEEDREPLTIGLIGIEVYDRDGRKACTVSATEAAKACFRAAREPEIAVVSAQGTRLLLGFDTETNFRQAATDYTFGLFDIADGRLLFSGGSDALEGLPRVEGDAVIAVEAGGRRKLARRSTPAADPATAETFLVRHAQPGGREVLSRIPIDAAVDVVARYAFTPDGARCLLQVEGPRPRLLIMPVAKDVPLRDCQEIALP